jgi:phage protein D
MVTCKERKRGKMARKKISRRWDDVHRSFAVWEVLMNHFPESSIHIDDTKMPVGAINQQGETDWQFVTRQAQLAQREYYLDEKGVHWEIPRRNQKPSRLLRFVDSPIGVGEIISYSFQGLGAGIPGRVVLKGKDFYTKKPFIETVDRSNAEDFFEMTITAGAEAPDEGDQLEQGDNGREIVRNSGARTAAEARELANAIYKEARYGALKMRMELVGDPTMRSRRVVMVWGIGPAIDGLWWAKTVTNTWSGGFRQSADLTREGLADKLKIPLTTKQKIDLVRASASRMMSEGLI